MAYKLLVTKKAENDLDEIVSYLLTEFGSVQAAMAIMEAVGETYVKLTEDPWLYPLCAQPLLQARMYRKVPVRGYLLLYRVDEENNTVYIERFFGQMEDYVHKI